MLTRCFPFRRAAELVNHFFLPGETNNRQRKIPRVKPLSIIQLFLIAGLVAPFSYSQFNELRFDSYTVDKGLSQNQVFCIYQDSKGLLWFGTQDGLNMYDGYNFKVFRHQPGNLNSLLDYAVNTICETEPGIFWIGTRQGMSRLDLRTGKYTHFTNNTDSSNSLVDNNIWLIKEDSEKTLWIATRNGLSRFDPAANKFENFKAGPKDSNTISNDFVFAIVEDDKKNLWIGGRGGLDRYDMKKKKFYNYKLFPDNPSSISLNGVLTLFIKNNLLWIGSYSGLYSLNLQDVDKEKIYFRSHLSDENSKNIFGNLIGRHDRLSVRSIYAGNDNTIWAGTYGAGLIRYQPETGSIKVYNKTDKTGSLSENYIVSLFEDKQGVLWIGTSSSGLNKYNRSSERFITIKIPESSGASSKVSSLTEDRSGNLWVGTESGDIIKVTNQFSGNPKLYYYTTEKFLKSYFNQIEIRSIIEDKNGNIWAGSFGNGIYIIDPVAEKVDKITQDVNKPNTIANDFVHAIYESSDQSIWIGTGAGGLNKFNPKDQSFIYYKHDTENEKSISSNEVTAVCEDSEGFIWAGTSIAGLNKMDPVTEQFERFSHDISDITTISSNRIICLYIDRKNNVWAGTFGGGLNKWISESNSFEHYTTENGLPSNIINSIVEDTAGNLWISTDNGISVFKVESNSFKNYNYNDGLQGNEFLQGAGYKSKRNENIYFGGANGLNILNPNDFKMGSKISEIVFTDFKIFNRSVFPGEESSLKSNILYAEEVVLSHDQNFFTFEFASLDFNNPDKNQYAFKLEGFNRDWVNTGNQRFATYTNLDPGEYVFRVKATNSEGIWNDEGISIRVILLPPWWQTWWAYILYAVFIIAILYSLRQYEMKRVSLRNELKLKDFEARKLQEVDQLKSHFFANISHEFRTPLTLILGLLQKFENKTTDKEDIEDCSVMKRNAVRLLQLINQLLELSKIEAGKSKIAASENDIVKFIKRIFVSFASYAEQKRIKLLFNRHSINAESIEEVNVFFDKDKLEKIISNLISNAVKYTPEGNEIEVKIVTQNNFVEIKVINTGVTISQADLVHLFDRYYKVDRSESKMIDGTGIGLALVKELVEMHKGTISVSSEYDVTEFTVKLPLGKDHLKPDEIIYDDDENPQDEKFESFESEIAEELSLIDAYSEGNNSNDIILVVEDHSDLRKYIKESLTDTYQVIEAPNGKAGFTKAADMIPDLIISDVMMPEMDGYTFCNKIKSNEKTSHIPVILLTAKASTKDKLEGLELGADDYIIKPFNPDELKIRVRNLIKIREQLRQKFTSEMVLKPNEVVVPSSQVQFIEKLKSIIESNLEDDSFGVERLSDEMGMSRSQLHRKLKAITNQSTTEFIRNLRLHRAAQLILQDAGSMSEIAYEVGFNSQAYFNKSFQDLFGCSPTDYKKNSQ